MADEIKIASALSLINSSGDSCVLFMALTEVGAAIGGSEGDRLQRVGIDAGAEIGLGNVGVMPLREYARSASSEGLSYLRQRLKSGTAWDQFQGLPGVIAVAHDEDARELSLDLIAAMRHVGSSPDMFECYSRLPDDLLPAFIEAARDRKSVVSGKSVAVRVDIGGSRIIK